jgi:purine-binding chemotaxis protein CheW
VLVLELVLDDVRYAVEADRVAEIAPRVLVTPLPDAPSPVLGVITVRGKLVPVVDLRGRLGHAAREPRVEDHFVIAIGARRTVALVADRALGLRDIRVSELRPPVLPSQQIAGIAVLPDGLVLLQDLDRVLSLDEERAIDRGIEALSP